VDKMILRPTPRTYIKKEKTTQRDTQVLGAYTPTRYPQAENLEAYTPVIEIVEE